MRKKVCIALCFCIWSGLAGCGADEVAERIAPTESVDGPYTTDTRIEDVINDPVFGEYGRLIFPVNSGYYSGDTLGELGLTWYRNIDPEATVEIVNYLRDHAAAGETVFYDIYSDEEKAADPAKENTGLFFFQGDPGQKFAVCNARAGRLHYSVNKIYF